MTVHRIEIDVGLIDPTRIRGRSVDGQVSFDAFLMPTSIQDQVDFVVSLMSYMDVGYDDLVIDSTGVGLAFDMELKTKLEESRGGVAERHTQQA